MSGGLRPGRAGRSPRRRGRVDPHAPVVRPPPDRPGRPGRQGDLLRPADRGRRGGSRSARPRRPRVGRPVHARAGPPVPPGHVPAPRTARRPARAGSPDRGRRPGRGIRPLRPARPDHPNHPRALADRPRDLPDRLVPVHLRRRADRPPPAGRSRPPRPGRVRNDRGRVRRRPGRPDHDRPGPRRPSGRGRLDGRGRGRARDRPDRGARPDRLGRDRGGTARIAPGRPPDRRNPQAPVPPLPPRRAGRRAHLGRRDRLRPAGRSARSRRSGPETF